MAMTLTFEFDCTPEHLFPFLIEHEQMLKWMHGVTRIEPITDGPVAVGEKAKLWIKEGRKETEYVSEVTAFEQNRRIAVDLTGGCFGVGTTITADYRLSTSASGGTSLVYTCEMRGMKLLVRIMDILFRPMNKRILRKMMATLKKLAEEKD